jgi:peptide deformylase
MVPVPEASHPDVRSQLAELGVRQADDPVLRLKARRLALPEETERVRGVLQSLLDVITKLQALHDFTNGVGLAAPQVGQSLALAVVRPVGALPIRLINPSVVECSTDKTLEFEGCHSFFDYRGRVPRPQWIRVESTDLDGCVLTQRYEGSIARLVAHEIDHLYGTLYVDLLPSETDLVDISTYNSHRWQ